MHMMDRVRSAAQVTTRAPYAPTFARPGGQPPPHRRAVAATVGRRRSGQVRTRARVGADAFVPGTWVDDTHFKDPKGYVWTVASAGTGYTATSDAYAGATASGADKLTLAAAIVAFSTTHTPSHPDEAKTVSLGVMDYAKRAAIIVAPPVVGLLFGPFGFAFGMVASASAAGTMLVKDVIG